MHRKIIYWKLRDRELQLGERTLVMGVLNVTPDSFSDGGRFVDPEAAVARALQLEEDGADIIDIGAESTRPGAEPVSADEEWRRLVPILKRLRGALRVPVSLDTYKSETAERAISYDVHIINDPSGLTVDPSLAKIAATGDMGLVLNHMRGRPEQWAKLGPLPDVIGTVTKELDAAVNRARHAGVDRQRIVVDPGLGFGKRKEQNSQLIAQLAQLSKLELPVLVGPSRKSFLAHGSEGETLYATAAAVTAAILNGAHIVRVHDVKEMLAVARVADEIVRSEHAPVEQTAEKAAQKAKRPSQPGANGPIWEEKRSLPPRPPMRRPEPPAQAEATPMPPRDIPAAPREPAVPRARDTESVRPPERERPARTPDRPFRKPDGDRSRRDQPFRREDRPAAGRFGRSDDRPQRTGPERPQRFGDDRPQRSGPDRPQRFGDDRPPRRDNDRPPRRFGTGRGPDNSGDRPVRRTGPGDRPFGNSGSGRSFGNPGDRPTGRPPLRGGDRPKGRPFGNAGDRPAGRPPSKPGDRPAFRKFGPPRGGRPGGRPGGPPRKPRP